MVQIVNAESLTRTLSNPKGGAQVVVVYSDNYGPSVQVLNHVRKLVELSPSMQLISINSREHQYLLSLPILNVSEIPSVLLFHNGRSFCSPVTDIFQVTDRIRRLSIVSMEMDDFESIGTNIRVPDIPETHKWRSKSSSQGNANGSRFGSLRAILSPLYAIMDSLFDI